METTMANQFLFLVAFLTFLPAGFTSADQVAPSFEVASIKLSDPANRSMDGCFMKGQPGGQTFVGRCIPLRLMITYSYKIIDSQLVGGPAWLDSELYDFDAKADHSLTREELAPMMQTMLAERFKLQFHKEARTLPALALTVDKGGNKMTANTGPNTWEIAMVPVPGTIPKFKGTRCPTSYLSWWLAQRQNRPVVDKTGLAGYWDFTLEFVPDGMGEGSRKSAGGEPMPPMEGPSLPVAIREQLGLRLETEKAPVDVYVIDHLEKPTGN
jgi:uncharacterized protein (TIGR03435 family)